MCTQSKSLSYTTEYGLISATLYSALVYTATGKRKKTKNAAPTSCRSCCGNQPQSNCSPGQAVTHLLLPWLYHGVGLHPLSSEPIGCKWNSLHISAKSGVELWPSCVIGWNVWKIFIYYVWANVWSVIMYFYISKLWVHKVCNTTLW